MQRQLEEEVVEILRENFDGTPDSVERTMRRIGKAIRGSIRPALDPRQQALRFEVQNA